MALGYLLDTSVLVGIVPDFPWSRRTVEEFALNRKETPVLTSIVSRGEILKLAKRRGWKAKKLLRMERCLRDFPQLNINTPSVINAYAMIGAWSERANVDAPNSEPPPKQSIRMGQNDLWIAATAHAGNLKLLSTDKDFTHLNNIWIDYIYIDPSKNL